MLPRQKTLCLHRRRKVDIGEGEEETVQGMKRKMEEMAEEDIMLKIKFFKLECYLLYKSMQMKAMSLHVECLEENNRKLSAENEILRVTKWEIISLPMNC